MITKTLTISALFFGAAVLCSAQPSPALKASPATTTTTTATTASGSLAPYTEGTVWEITMIKTKPGMGDDYLKQLAQGLKPIYDEEKKQKLILDYKIMRGDASSPHDYDILIMVQYANMAAFDGLRDKTEPIATKIMGGEDQRRSTMVKRMDVREILGTKTMREITLK